MLKGLLSATTTTIPARTRVAMIDPGATISNMDAPIRHMLMLLKHLDGCMCLTVLLQGKYLSSTLADACLRGLI
jgi:hypothetical protein